MNTYEENDLVVVSQAPDATVYRVTQTDGRAVGIIDTEIEHSHPRQRPQWVDCSILSRPSDEQIANYQAMRARTLAE